MSMKLKKRGKREISNETLSNFLPQRLTHADIDIDLENFMLTNQKMTQQYHRGKKTDDDTSFHPRNAIEFVFSLIR